MIGRSTKNTSTAAPCSLFPRLGKFLIKGSYSSLLQYENPKNHRSQKRHNKRAPSGQWHLGPIFLLKELCNLGHPVPYRGSSSEVVKERSGI